MSNRELIRNCYFLCNIIRMKIDLEQILEDSGKYELDSNNQQSLVLVGDAR